MASPDIFAFNKRSSLSDDGKVEVSVGGATSPILVPADAMFSSSGDTFSSSNGDEIVVEALESSTDSMDSEDCKKCLKKLVQPRVLSCLHIFCEQCIDKMLMEGGADSDKTGTSLECPDCKQVTKVGRNGATSLPFHFILTNILDLASIDISTLVCTSCKSKERAISRCSDCANFLCASCDNAHRFMRCFEEHQVIMLEQTNTESDSMEKVSIHKPLYCNVHATENLKYFCYSCEIPVCNDCLIVDHKATEHRYEIISEAEKHMRSDVEKLLAETKAKIEFCDKENGKLDTSLQELQSQHDVAREAIRDTYDAFINEIEKCKENAMNDLKMLHSEREIKIMEQFHKLEKSVEQMNYCASFTRKLLENGNGPEILSLKKMISVQLSNLIASIPKVDVNYSLEFTNNQKKFQEMAQDLFGKFRTETTSLSPKESTPPPTLPGHPPILAQKNSTVNGSNVSQSTLTGSHSVTASSPISLPTSMQSSFDGDMSGLSSNFMLSNSILPAESPSPAAHVNNQLTVPPVQSINVNGPINMVEYNLHRLATICDPTPDMTDSILPAAPPAATNSFIISDMLGGSDQQMQNNLLALAKMNLNQNGDLTNGSLLGGGSSNGMESLPIMGDFSNISSATSPIMQQPPPNVSNGGNDMRLSAYSQFSANTGRSKATPMQIRVKFGSLGPARAQFNSPHGFCLGLDEEIIVADTNNHRIEVSF